MTDKLTEIAMAICGGWKNDWPECKGPGCSCGEWEQSVSDAKAALEVMREPTDKMLRAGVAVQIDGKKGGDPDQQVPVPGTGQGDMQFYEFWRDIAENLALRKRHRAMIDAALEVKDD